MPQQKDPSSGQDIRGPTHFGYGEDHWARDVTDRPDGASDRAADVRITSLARKAIDSVHDDLSTVEASVQDAEVTLSGEVANPELREQIERAVALVDGVRILSNRIVVAPR